MAEGAVPARYMNEAWADDYATGFVASTFEVRCKAYYRQVLKNEAPPRGSKRVYYAVACLAAGSRPDEGPIHDSLCEFIEGRKDCADFVMHGILRMLYQFPDAISSELAEHARQAVLGFKYWPDEPGQDDMCTWTENHQILFASAAYLAGQLYPEAVFENTGETGREKMAAALPRIQRWMDLRFKTGFSEWLSNVYYDEDWAPLLNLADFALDRELAGRASIILDLLLFDMAANSFQGVFGSSHGRSYEPNKKWAALEGTADTAKLLFGIGAWSAFDNMSAPLFAMSDNYEVPQVLYDIAFDAATAEHRQRIGIKVDEAERWGLRPDNFEDGMVLLSLEAMLHPRTANLTMSMFDAFGWWDNAFFEPFRNYRGLISVLRRLGLLPKLARLLQKDLGRNTREEVNIYTYRSQDYMLSSAVDYRPGYGGDQQHIWQATLGPDAVCFTTHPARHAEASPNYWTGSGSLPRVAQLKNVVMAVYRINTLPGLYITHRLRFTHAWLPRDCFDEVEEREGWLLARKGDGYLALRSQQPYRWQTAAGDPSLDEDEGREVIAEGKNNIWVCEMGSKDEWGGFGRFTQAVCEAPLTFKGSSLVYESPSQGRLEFGWRGPFRREGRAVSLDGFARYDSPYAQVEFPAECMDIRHGEHWLRLDWKTGRREASAFVA